MLTRTPWKSAEADVRPTIALAMGDPAGVGPELAAKLLADEAVVGAARLVLFGHRSLLDAGATAAGMTVEIETAHPDEVDARPGPVLVESAPWTLAMSRRTATEEGGAFACACFRDALDLAMQGRADAVCYLPFNKFAMRLAWPGYDDDIRYVREMTGWTGAASEFNVLDGVWNARVTSHIPLSAVAGLITTDAISDALDLTYATMRASGVGAPRIAVAALNPHAGDGGAFGREEIEVIAPAVRNARARGLNVDGPFPADTVFIRARGGAFDAVLTMFHDQGQIAMKLMGFERGVTYLGGFPFPISTPAHGTAYDIAGEGRAHAGAGRAAILLAAAMAGARRTQPREALAV